MGEGLWEGGEVMPSGGRWLAQRTIALGSQVAKVLYCDPPLSILVVQFSHFLHLLSLIHFFELEGF